MPKILIVDDHAGFRVTLRAALEKVGYQVVELGRGREVVRRAGEYIQTVQGAGYRLDQP